MSCPSHGPRNQRQPCYSCHKVPDAAAAGAGAPNTAGVAVEEAVAGAGAAAVVVAGAGAGVAPNENPPAGAGAGAAAALALGAGAAVVVAAGAAAGFEAAAPNENPPDELVEMWHTCMRRGWFTVSFPLLQLLLLLPKRCNGSIPCNTAGAPSSHGCAVLVEHCERRT